MSRAALLKLTAIVALSAAAGVALSNWQRGRVYVRNYENVLGTSMEVKVLASSESAADRATAC